MPLEALSPVAFLRLGLLAALVAGVSPPAAAAQYATQATSITLSSSANGPRDEQSHFGAQAGASSTQSSVVHGSGALVLDAGAQAVASADTGGVHVMAAANTRLTEPRYNYQTVVAGSATAHASFDDQLVLGAASHASGTQALLTFRVDVSGLQALAGQSSWDRGWSGTTRWSFAAVVGLTSVYQFQEVQWTPDGRTVSGTGSFGSIEITAPVVLGTSFNVSIGGDAAASASLGAYGYEPSSAYLNALSDLSHTVGWGGIVALTTTDGTAITGYTALGESGFDYRLPYAAAVPEPQAVALFGGGLVLLLGVHLRGARRQRAHGAAPGG